METLQPGGVFLPHFDVFRVILCLHKARCWHGKHGSGISDNGSDMRHRDDPAHHMDCRRDQASWVRLPSTRPGSGCHSAERSRQFTKKPFFSRGKMKRLSRTVTRRASRSSRSRRIYLSPDNKPFREFTASQRDIARGDAPPCRAVSISITTRPGAP